MRKSLDAQKSDFLFDIVKCKMILYRKEYLR